jgi:DNA-binding response OmpR family regulator
MPSPVKNVPPTVRPPEDITLLLLTPHEEDVTAVRNVFHHPGWKVERCANLTDAQEQLPQAAVVLCERNLPDGDWKDVLESLATYANPPFLIVTCRHADELLWAEVLNLGGYDVLQKPFETSEVLRVVNMAWRFRKSPASQRQITPSPLALSA